MAAPGFGKGTDHFGFASASLVLIDSNNTPKSKSQEFAKDQDGNNAGVGTYDGSAAEAIECVYRLISSTLDLSTLALGYKLVVAEKTCVVSIAVATSNGEWPTITVSGFKGVTNETDMPTFTLPAITINGKKIAQVLGFTVDADCRLTSSSLNAAGEFHFALDDDGEVGAMAFTGANVEVQAEAVEVEGVVAITAGVGWTQTQGPGAKNNNIGWGTASATQTMMLEPDAP